MKKILSMLLVFITVTAISAKAQETKTKPVTTPTDKVHNVVHPHHKVSHGTKYKHKTATGKKTTTTVKTSKTEAVVPKKKTKTK
jgi:hypothetical protein